MKSALVVLLLAAVCPAVTSAQSAAQLSALEVRGVRSASSPAWESIGVSAYSTTRNHGGAFVEVKVVETGIAGTNSRWCTLAGNQMAAISTTRIWGAGNRQVGTEVVWQRKFPYAPFSSGNLSCWSRSVNSPYTTKSDVLVIR